MLQPERELKEYAFHLRDFHSAPAEEALPKLQKKAEKLGLPSDEEEIRKLMESIEGKKPSVKSFQLTDEGNVSRFVFENIKSLRYVDSGKGYWVRWSKTRWAGVSESEILRLALKSARKLMYLAVNTDNVARKKAIGKHALRSSKPGKLSELLKTVIISGKLTIKDSVLESTQNAHLLNCANCMVDLRNGDKLPHDRKLYIQQLCPIEYDDKAVSETWLKFIDSATGGNEELKEFLQIAIGYALTGDTSQKAIFILHGPTNTGKTTFNEILGLLLNDYAMATDMSTFLKGHGRAGHRNDLARLRTARLVIASEAGSEETLDAPTVKRLSGQDTIIARFLYQNDSAFKPQFTIFLATNDLPRMPGSDDALWKRLIVLPFRHQPQKLDLKLTDKLKKQLPGILAWAVEGAKLYYKKKKLVLPQVVIDATAETRMEVDPVHAFIQEKCITGKKEWCTVDAITKAFAEWCDKEESTYSTDKFWKDLSRLGYMRGKRKVKGQFTGKKEEKRIRLGISLKD